MQQTFKQSRKQYQWLKVLPIHPAALLVPPVMAEERRRLGKDIKEHGLQIPVVIFVEDGKRSLLDGISRLDAMEEEGLEVIKDGALAVPFQEVSGVDPIAYVVGANVHRRHFTTKGKRELAGNFLKTFSDRSDRQIAEWIGISHHTVNAVRCELEASGQIAQTEIRTDSKGRHRPASSPETPAKIISPVPDSTEPVVQSEGDSPRTAPAPVQNKIIATPTPDDNLVHDIDQELASFEAIRRSTEKVLASIGRNDPRGIAIRDALSEVKAGLQRLRSLVDFKSTPVKVSERHLLKDWKHLSATELEERVLKIQRATGDRRHPLHLEPAEWRIIDRMREHLDTLKKTEAATSQAA